MIMDQSTCYKITKKALATLRNNLHHNKANNKTYSFILPSKEFYMHQWFWDSCMHAMGIIYFDKKQAFNEIESLLSGQWENGHIGHITFSKDETRYFPGPSVWQTEPFSPTGVISSGIIQPPLLAISVEHIDTVLSEKGEGTVWVDSILDRIIEYHSYLKSHRDSEDSGLITSIHPWESGTDNSPRWDEILATIPITIIPKYIIEEIHARRTDTKHGKTVDRPQQDDYYRYLYLIDLYKNLGWDTQKILSQTPFAVKDTLINAIWAKANFSLAHLLIRRNRHEEADQYSKWASQTTQALQNSWNPKKKMYAIFDVSHRQKRAYYADTIANFMPLYTQAATPEQRNALISHLTNPDTYWTRHAVPSTSLDSDYFEESRYWRGPSWPITNLFLIEGLYAYDYTTCATRIIQKTCDMIESCGFFEYYNPEGKMKKGIGFGAFSWTAAIYLYLTQKYSTPTQKQPYSQLPLHLSSNIIKV